MSQIALVIIIIFVIYSIFFWKFDNFVNNEKFEIYDKLGMPRPSYSRACCGNAFFPVAGENDPKVNVSYYASNITHLGDGDSEEGCRCLTPQEINFLGSRGGNNYDYTK